MSAALQGAIASKIFSKPYPLPLPLGLPFCAAVCSVSLPAGCAPPNGSMPLRVGCGVSETIETAAFLALAEAAERHAIQYDPQRDASVKPILYAGGSADSIPFSELALGAPSGGLVDSRGCAAGDSFSSAANRALYELLERHHVGPRGALRGSFFVLDTDAATFLEPHIAFLSSQLRELHIAVMVSPHGYSVSRVICRDLNESRCTIGSACGAKLEDTIRRAAEEAILLWRNLVEMEARSAPIPDASTNEGVLVHIYRGVARIDASACVEKKETLPSVPALDSPIAQIVNSVTGSRVRVFNLTAPSVGVPVARAVLG